MPGGIGYGLRQILDAQRACGIENENIVIGGAGQHPLVRQLLADACGVTVVSTASSEPVLLGSAILGAVAGNVAASLPDASGSPEWIKPIVAKRRLARYINAGM